MKELISNVEQWARDRNLDKTGSIKGQQLKTSEEVAELVIAINKDDIDLIKDSIGDIFVTLIVGNILYKNIPFKGLLKGIKPKNLEFNRFQFINLLVNDLKYLLDYKYCDIAMKNMLQTLNSYGYSLEECLQLAYNEIKNRKGKVIDGQFVKEI